MSLLSVAPEAMTTASGDLENLGSALRSVNAAAASQTTAIAAPAADEVSAAITALFGAHAQGFQALSAKAAAFHDEFVNLLNGGATQYLNTELTNAQQTLAHAANAPAQALLGRPLIGNGAGLAAVAAATPARFADGAIELTVGTFNNAGFLFESAGQQFAKAFQSAVDIPAEVFSFISSPSLDQLGSYLTSILFDVWDIITGTLGGLAFGGLGLVFGAAGVGLSLTVLPLGLVASAVTGQ